MLCYYVARHIQLYIHTYPSFENLNLKEFCGTYRKAVCQPGINCLNKCLQTSNRNLDVMAEGGDSLPKQKSQLGEQTKKNRTEIKHKTRLTNHFAPENCR